LWRIRELYGGADIYAGRHRGARRDPEKAELPCPDCWEVRQRRIIASSEAYETKASAKHGCTPASARSSNTRSGRQLYSRNDFAHQLQQGDESLAVRILPWLIVANAIPWLLRGLLLLRAGVDPNVPRDGYLASNRFEHFRANTAQHVRELGWELAETDEER
jgi:hypothetical protein